MARLGILISILLFLASCSDKKSSTNSLPSSSGKFGEVLVVVDSALEKGLTGNALNNVFLEAAPALPQKEPKFRMSTVIPAAFKSILKRSRNIISVVKKEGLAKNMRIRRDEFANPQLLIQIEGSSDQEIESVLIENKEKIQALINQEELKRLQTRNNKKPNKKIQKEIEDLLACSFTIPPGFVSMSKGEAELWIKKEKKIGEHQVLQGISFYKRPYKSKEDFAVDTMLLWRNRFTVKHIQGPRDNSFMQVYEELNPLSIEVNIGGQYGLEYRGLWNMKNDFMGGPFIHYSVLSPDGSQIYEVDGFVYAPKFNKREYLRELEAIIKSISF